MTAPLHLLRAEDPAAQPATLTFASPLGEMRLAAFDDGLCGAWFVDQADVIAEGRQQHHEAEARILAQARLQLEQWYAGERETFDLPLAPRGTPFQRQVWDGLLTLPFGTTTTYGDLAHRIGRPRSVRPLALALSRNPISIIIPCHRVIGFDTALTGFGGGLKRKRALLIHEGNRYPGHAARTRRVCDGQAELALEASADSLAWATYRQAIAQ
ncbi:methylated-DNA--[protein]-cysteine S-methyltransferase [Bordetella genomosp. 1]|uniref:Methylated-DNA--protein-cysteine methyltransferase n=1 Tax=Bordetella genomosp. 1 TaxID=1395607 RepID=A0ABX4F606_9BORD|nr:methylated-DNA--[protein]-cysteine S-methyltransferase [Bordetella genomosp. 1]OZI68831.1 cysteine methyltransferase [Bordetella genomosp. 1]